MTLLVNELFAGIGAFRKALINIGIDHQIVGISEIDKYAIASYTAIYGETRNYGDIAKVEKLDYADMWTYGFPCQDISNSGLQKGIIKGKTRSGLLYEVERLLEYSVECGEAPKYLIMENVKNLVSKKFINDFDKWLDKLNELGYETYWKVLNAADYGIPQKRERVFAVSIRKDIDTGFTFPTPLPLEIKFNDLLEDEVDQKYYIPNETLEYFIYHDEECKRGGLGFRFEPKQRGEQELAKTITTKVDRTESNYVQEKLSEGSSNSIKKV